MAGEPPPLDDLLRSFLADRDAACPACGYNLRGVEAPACPECGVALNLALGRGAGLVGRRLPYALLLGLLFGVAVAFSTRAVMSIESSLRAPRQIIYLSGNTIGSPAGVNTAPSLSANGPVTVTTRTTGAGPVVLRSGGTTLSANQISLQVPAAGLATGPTWSSLRWNQWAEVTWWPLLALAAGAALVMLWRERGRGPNSRTDRLVAWTAALGATGVLAYHVVTLALWIA